MRGRGFCWVFSDSGYAAQAACFAASSAVPADTSPSFCLADPLKISAAFTAHSEH